MDSLVNESDWTCPHCSHLNDAFLTTCGMCNKPMNHLSASMKDLDMSLSLSALDFSLSGLNISQEHLQDAMQMSTDSMQGDLNALVFGDAAPIKESDDQGNVQGAQLTDRLVPSSGQAGTGGGIALEGMVPTQQIKSDAIQIAASNESLELDLQLVTSGKSLDEDLRRVLESYPVKDDPQQLEQHTQQLATPAEQLPSQQFVAQQRVTQQMIAAKPTQCRCKKSKCLKLYCECFAANKFCNETCKCINCHNNEEHALTTRLEAMQQKLQENQRAFDGKLDVEGDAKHVRGCKCKRSGCRKKYCECYQNGVSCTEHCQCVGCKNRQQEEKSSDGFGVFQYTPSAALYTKSAVGKEKTFDPGCFMSMKQL